MHPKQSDGVITMKLSMFNYLKYDVRGLSIHSILFHFSKLVINLLINNKISLLLNERLI
ncbi:hypothetical protein NUSPORA_02178 [Nucleospora cyclopteri]